MQRIQGVLLVCTQPNAAMSAVYCLSGGMRALPASPLDLPEVTTTSVGSWQCCQGLPANIGRPLLMPHRQKRCASEVIAAVL